MPRTAHNRHVGGWGIGLVLFTTLSAGPHGDCRAAASGTGVTLTPLVEAKLESPTLLTHAGDGTGTLYVLEQPGRIRIIRGGSLAPRPFLDVGDRVLAGGERGLLGLAFHPDYRRNGRFFVNYTRKPDGGTVLAEYRRNGDGDRAGRDEKVLLVVPQPYANHNGGMLAFGPDGYLYVGLGDGGAGGDPQNRAQNPDELLGKILRIDVNRDVPYAIPDDNPYARGGGRPEIYASGFRNPWRLSFDRTTGALWAADVGQHRWEEIDVVWRGGNYGWKIMEGNHCFEPAESCRRGGLIPPVAEYARQSPRCAVIGGHVYRGAAMPALVGTYVFGDFCSGEILGVPASNYDRMTSPASPAVLGQTEFNPSAFGEDERGELYIVDHRGGGVYRLTAGSPASRTAPASGRGAR